MLNIKFLMTSKYDEKLIDNNNLGLYSNNWA